MQSGTQTAERIWDPMEIFSHSSDHKYAVLILNQPILLPQSLVLQLWQNAQIKVTADGGTNRWMEYLGPLSDKVYNGTSPEYKPDMITGDLDSALPEIVTKLQSVGVTVIKTPDQNYTDYSKALMEISAASKRKNIKLDTVYVLAETAGRLDQIIANIDTLYQQKKYIADVKSVINVSGNSLTWLLEPGQHKIKIPEILRQNETWVGIIPFGSNKNILTTTGLKWNLDKSTLAFGELISTSNTYDGSPEVTLTTDTNMIWTMGIEPLVPL